MLFHTKIPLNLQVPDGQIIFPFKIITCAIVKNNVSHSNENVTAFQQLQYNWHPVHSGNKLQEPYPTCVPKTVCGCKPLK